MAVTNSVVFDTGSAVTHFEGSTSSYVNSIFYGNDAAIARSSSISCRSLFKNCIFTECAKGWCVIDSDRFCDPPSDVLVNNCLFWNPGDYGPQSCGSASQNGNIWGDPLFLNSNNWIFIFLKILLVLTLRITLQLQRVIITVTFVLHAPLLTMVEGL